jgi:hypothetical protein
MYHCLEAMHQAIAEGKAVIAGQAVEQAHEPLDQVQEGLDDRQLSAAG